MFISVANTCKFRTVKIRCKKIVVINHCNHNLSELLPFLLIQARQKITIVTLKEFKCHSLQCYSFIWFSFIIYMYSILGFSFKSISRHTKWCCSKTPVIKNSIISGRLKNGNGSLVSLYRRANSSSKFVC